MKNYSATPLINPTVIDHTHFKAVSGVCKYRGVTTIILSGVSEGLTLQKWTLLCEKLIHNMITAAKGTPLQW